jgi:hypothetical protein
MNHPIQHMVGPEILSRARALAEQNRREERFRAYVAANFLWILPLFLICVLLAVVATAAVWCGCVLGVSLLATHGVPGFVVPGPGLAAVFLLPAGVIFFGAFFLSMRPLLMWLDARANAAPSD